MSQALVRFVYVNEKSYLLDEKTTAVKYAIVIVCMLFHSQSFTSVSTDKLLPVLAFGTSYFNVHVYLSIMCTDF